MIISVHLISCDTEKHIVKSKVKFTAAAKKVYEFKHNLKLERILSRCSAFSYWNRIVMFFRIQSMR